MLFRTLLLFLCMSSGLCATLGLLQMQKEEDMPAQEAAADLDNTLEVSDGNVQDTEATTDDISNGPSPHVKEGLLEKLIANDFQQEADKDPKEEVDTLVVDGAPAEEVVTNTDNKTEGVPVEESKETEIAVNDQPSHGIPVVEAKVAEDQAQDQASQDIPMVEMKVAETPNQEQQSQEEDNEIKPIQTEEVPKKQEESHSGWGFNSIRNSFQNMHGYFDSLVELVGGRNGVCEYRCRYGELPAPRPGYQLPEPNGCSSSLVGFQVNAAVGAFDNICSPTSHCGYRP